MYEEVIWNVYHSRQCSARLKMDRNSMELDYWWARLFSQQLLLSCSISDQCLYIKVSFKSHLNFAAYLELTPGASLLMVMTSQLRFLPIYTICTLTISNLDLLLFLLNFFFYYFNQILIHWKNSQITALGFVCKILWGTSITLDGDGGFRFTNNQRERLKCKEADGTKRQVLTFTIFYFWSSGFTFFNGIIYSSQPPCKVSGQPYRWTLYLHWLSVCHNLQLVIQHLPPDSPCHQR